MLDSKAIPDHRSSGQTSHLSSKPSLFHEKFGDLGSPEAFVMRGLHKEKYAYKEINPLYIHLSVTGRCQANCRGCINMAFNNASGSSASKRTPFKETDPVRDARCILHLIEKNPGEPATICLYGGEPLLAADKLITLIKNIDNGSSGNDIRYMLYTNGELLEKTAADYPELIQRVWLFSVSIDGTRKQHELIRRGTHLEQIHAGLKRIKETRKGRVLMWSTLREEQSLLDCFNEFTHLNERGLADQFFWHWVETGSPFADIARYAKCYETELRQIMDVYIRKLQDGLLLPITHINELVLYLLSGKKRNSTACGVELARNYDIVDGRIHSCADLPLEYSIGTVAADGTPQIGDMDLSWLTNYKEDLGCRKCGVHSYCGGRCPVQAITGSNTRLKQYCQLMRLHVSIVYEYLDDIAAALETHEITTQDIYERSAFYVQFTDGTP